MNQDTTDLEHRSHVKVFRTPRPKPPHLLDPLNNNIRVRLKSIQSPNTTKNGPSDTLILNPFSATTLSLGLSPAVASLSHFRKKSTGDSLRNEFPKLESSDSLVSTPRVKPESNRGKTMLLYPSSSKFGSTSFKKKGSLIDFSESQDHNILSPRQGKANNKDELTNQPTFGSLTERKGLPQSIFAPKNDKVRLFKETELKKKKVEKKLKVTDDFPIIPVKISKNLNLQTPKHSPYISISAPNSTKASETGKSSGIKDWSAIATPKTKADAIKEENLMMDLESQEERKKRIVDLMSKELENRWGIRQISQETPISHNNDNEDGTPQSGEIFSDEGDRKELPDEFKSQNNRDLRIDLTENESESQVRKKPDRGDLKSRTRKLGTRKSVVFKTKEEFRGLGDFSGFRSMPRKNDVFSDSCVDFFQFNERNRFYDEFSEGFKQEPAQPHPIRDMENRDSAMMVAFNQNDKIIQPAFMQRVGSMCFTEFWTKKINLVFFKKIKKSSQYLRLNEPGRENETVYRPGKWKKEAFTKEKIMEHSSAWTTKSVALMKALEKQDGDSPTSTKAALSLFKKTQTPHVAENPWVNTDNETFTLAQKLRNTKPSLAIDSRGVSLESARHQHKQGEQSRFRKEKQTHLPNDIEDIYLKNIRKARLAKAGHYPVTEDKLNSNDSIHRSKSSIRPPLTAR